MAVLQHGAEQRGGHRVSLRALLSGRSRPQPGARHLVRRLLAARRRLRLGLVHVRPGTESLLLRHEQLRSVESGLPPGVGRGRAGRGRRPDRLPEQLLRVDPGPRRRQRRADLGLQHDPSGSVGPGRAQRERPRRPRDQRPAAQGAGPRGEERLLLRVRSRDGRDAPRALDVRLQRHLPGCEHGNRPAALRHDEDDVHRPRGSTAVRAGRREHRRRLVSRHRRPELAERRVLPAHRTPVHPDLEQLRSVGARNADAVTEAPRGEAREVPTLLVWMVAWSVLHSMCNQRSDADGPRGTTRPFPGAVRRRPATRRRRLCRE